MNSTDKQDEFYSEARWILKRSKMNSTVKQDKFYNATVESKKQLEAVHNEAARIITDGTKLVA